MRHFVVLAFKGHGKDEVGKLQHLGTDRGKAIAEVNKPTTADQRRRELYELATPHIRRSYAAPVEKAKKATKKK